MSGQHRLSSLIAFFFSLCVSFTTASAVDLDPSTHQAIPGDFNGDGRIDALLQPLTNSVGGAILLQDGTGNLSVVAQGWNPGYLGLDWSADKSAITTADLNGDGLADVVIQPRQAGGNAAVLITDPTVQLLQVAQVIPTNYLGLDWSTAGHVLVAGDFDGDRQKELLLQAVNPGDGSAIVHADLSGHLVAVTQAIPDGYLNRRWDAEDVTLYVGDFNGDGRQDLLIQVNAGHEMTGESDYAILLADQNGHFTQVSEVWNDSDFGADWSPATHTLSVQTINGVTDIVLTAKNGGTNYVFQPNAQGQITQPTVKWTGNKSASDALKQQAASKSANIGISVVVAKPANTAPATNNTASTTNTQAVQTRSLMAQVTGNGPVAANATGEIQGSGGVNGGSATYSLPIVVPPGRKGIQPAVSLNYSSRGGNGEVGMGWSLSAGSAIHRCPATTAQDGYSLGVTYSATDRLCLDGQHLILTSGAYGVAGSVYHTDLESYTQVKLLGGDISSSASYFEVDYRNGRKAYYGYQEVPVNAPAALVWDITQEKDPAGNNVVYSHSNSYAPGEYHLAEIDYTGQTDSSGNVTNGDREVKFGYSTRSDLSKSYLAGGLSQQTQILTSIDTYTNSGGTHVQHYGLSYAASGATNRSLLQSVQECSYDSSGNQYCFAPTTFSWQAQAPVFKPVTPAFAVGEPGVVPNLVVAPDFLGTGTRQVKYEEFAGSTGAYFSLLQLDTAFNPVGQGADFGSLFGSIGWMEQTAIALGSAADFNNDGHADIVYQDNTKAANGTFPIKIATSVGQTFGFNAIQDTGITNAVSTANYVSSGDFSGNGWNDIIVSSDEADSTGKLTGTVDIYVFINPKNGQMSFAQQAGGALVTVNDGCSDNNGIHWPVVISQTSDMDGNGVPDLLVSGWCQTASAPGSAQMPEGIIFLSHATDGSGKVTATYKTFVSMGVTMFNQTGGCTGCAFKFLDINGDGLADLLFTKGDSTGDWYYQLNQGNQAFGPVVATGVNLAVGFQGAGLMVGDLRGDGKDDLLYTSGVAASWCVEKKISGDSDTTQICNSTILNQYPQFDETVYHYMVMSFEENSAGNYVPTANDYHLYASPNSQVGDLNGDGLSDVVYAIDSGVWTGSWQSYCNPSLCSNTDGVQVQADSSPAPDLMTGVTTGFGALSTWQYKSLAALQVSSRPATGSTTPYYYVDGNCSTATGTNTNDYYCFSSSMYVVSDYQTSNGIGGMREFTYGYEDAVYNNKGRDFQGFRAIRVNDLTANLFTKNTYRQDFPYTGKLTDSSVYVIGAATPFNETTYQWDCREVNPTAFVLGAACNEEEPTVTFWVYPVSSTETRKEWDSGDQISVTTTSYNGPDPQYGHIGSTVVSTTDASGTYATTTTPTYVEDTTNYCLDELSSNTVESAVSYTSEPSGYSYPANAGDITHLTNYAPYTNTCQVKETMQDPGTSYEKDTTYGYDSYDNVTSVTLNTPTPPAGSGTLATGQDYGFASRATTTTYTPDNYFVASVTNPALQVTTYKNVNPAYGEPGEMDAVDTVRTVYTYDSFGRKNTEQVGDMTAIDYTYAAAYKECPANAVYSYFIYQIGNTTKISCNDMLGRVVLSVSAGFQWGNDIYQTTSYDALGRTLKVSEPFLNSDYSYQSNQATPYCSSSPSYCTTYGYDVMNRVTGKTDPKGVVAAYVYEVGTGSRAAPSLSTLTTQTTVTPPDHAPVTSTTTLEVHDSPGKLLSTTDANGSETDFRYDADGNPILIQDAAGHQTLATYNQLDQKTQVVDPDQGTSSFAYDVLGELLQQTDAKVQQLTMSYDTLGRMTSKIQPEGESIWCYDGAILTATPAPGSCGSPVAGTGTGKLSAVSQYDGYFELYGYNTDGLLGSTDEHIKGNDYVTTTSYDGDGRVSTVNYPTTIMDTAPVATSVTASKTTMLVTDTTETLTSTTSSSDTNQAVGYHWVQASSNCACTTTFTSPTSLTTGFQPSAPGIYTYEMVTDDGIQGTPSNAVTVTVQPTPPATMLSSSESSTYAATTDSFDGTAALEWGTSVDATAFRLLVSVDGGAYNPVANCCDQTTSGFNMGSPSFNLSGLGSHSENDIYTYKAEGYANGVYSPDSPLTSVQVDYAPAAPASASAPANSNWDGSFTVSWTPPASGVATYYYVDVGYTYDDPPFGKQWQDAAHCTSVSTTPSAVNPAPPANSCLVPGNKNSMPSLAGTNYHYIAEVSACNGPTGSGICSATTANTGAVNVSYLAPPAAPTGLQASPSPSVNGSFTLSWTAPANAVQYRVYRSTNGGNYVWIDTFNDSNSGTITLAQSGLSKGNYTYAISGWNQAGEGPTTAPMTVSVTGPAAPTLAQASEGSNGNVVLDWSAVSSNYYLVYGEYFYTSGGSTGFLEVDQTPNTYYRDIPGTSYNVADYYVEACNGAGCTRSNTIAVSLNGGGGCHTCAPVAPSTPAPSSGTSSGASTATPSSGSAPSAPASGPTASVLEPISITVPAQTLSALPDPILALAPSKAPAKIAMATHKQPWGAPVFAPPVYQAYADARVEPASGTAIPAGASVTYVYNVNGYLSEVVNGVNPNRVYWQATAVNAREQILGETYGNNVQSIRDYFPESGYVKDIQSGVGGGTGLQYLSYTWQELGNLASRQDQRQSLNETFGYDALNRLTSAQVTAGSVAQPAVTYAYDALGNITCKSDVTGTACSSGSGGYTYGGQPNAGPHAVTQVVGVSGGTPFTRTYSYDADGNMVNRNGLTVTWSSDNMATCLDLTGGNCTATGSVNWSAFNYAPDKHRYYQNAEVNGSPETTVYAGSLEIITDSTGTHNRYNLSAYGKAIAIIDLEAATPGSPTITDQYLLTDNLGSVDVATTSTGAVVGSTGFSFGAFGSRRDAATWQVPASGTAVTADRTAVTHRGFTGHEMLDGLGLIHMNGRVYNPTLGRFLSVDPVFQFPTNTQSLNPYSYVLNNPLSLTDPTGYADKCPAGQTCGGTAPKQQQTQKSQGYGGHGGESSRIHEGKANGAGMKLSALGRSVGFVFDNKTQVVGGQLENGATFSQKIAEGSADSKQSGSGATATPQDTKTTSGVNLGTVDIGGTNDALTATPADQGGFDSVNSEWLKNGNVRVSEINGVVLITINLTVSGAHADEIATGITASWNGASGTYDGKQYKVEANIKTVRSGGDLQIKFMSPGMESRINSMLKLGQYVAGASDFGSSVMLLSSKWNTDIYTAAHEFGHNLGLMHAGNRSGDIMSYDHGNFGMNESVSGRDLALIANHYH